MTQQRIGAVVSAADSNAALASVEDLERRGISAAWMTSGSAGGGEALSVFAAAGTRTSDIMMGTAITQTFPRHPVAVAQQTLTLAQFAPGRFRLGLGTSGQSGMEQSIGANFRAPLAHLREYIRICKALLQEGSVDHSGRFYQARSSIPAPVDVPVMAAALGVRAYEICGAESDGAISWVCPRSYLQDVALPAMQRGAERAGRETPPLVAHVPVCVHDDPDGGAAGRGPAVPRFRPRALLRQYVHRRRVPGGVRGFLERRNGGRRGGVRRRIPGCRGSACNAGHGRNGAHGLPGGCRRGSGSLRGADAGRAGPGLAVADGLGPPANGNDLIGFQCGPLSVLKSGAEGNSPSPRGEGVAEVTEHETDFVERQRHSGSSQEGIP